MKGPTISVQTISKPVERGVCDAEIPLELLPAFGFTYRPAVESMYTVGVREHLVFHRKNNDICVEWRDVRIQHARTFKVGNPEPISSRTFVKLSDILAFLEEYHAREAADNVKSKIRNSLNKTLELLDA
jgi:hypothetical protein